MLHCCLICLIICVWYRFRDVLVVRSDSPFPHFLNMDPSFTMYILYRQFIHCVTNGTNDMIDARNTHHNDRGLPS